ncbi:type IV toxin-antitoxin system AbiEi family antitoxin [Diaphorobacter sp. C33]|uniref:type IV toxin-antitoxin system AbiEi family antitoxin n=1 Tax=Diaphorobacter sp. C33 TaxID=3060154 RepID=UPI0034E94CD1
MQATIYCWTGREKLMMRYRLRPDPHGMTVILDAFWVPMDNTARPIAPQLLSMPTGSPRLTIETGKWRKRCWSN